MQDGPAHLPPKTKNNITPPPPQVTACSKPERERKPEENYEIRNGMACDGKENQRSAGIGGGGGI